MALKVRIHLQDTHLLCAQACVQMIMGFLFPKKRLIKQASIVTTMTSAWATNPTQLCKALNDAIAASQKPPNGFTTFKVYAVNDSDAAMAQAYAAFMKGWPSVVLTGGGGHWEVFTGMTSGPRGMRLVHTRNPAPDRTSLAELEQPPKKLLAHSRADDCVDENLQPGNVDGDGDPADEVSVWRAWLDTRFTVCTRTGWTGKYVVVAPKLQPVWPPDAIAQPVDAGSSQPVHLTPANAAPTALAALDASGLPALRSWHAAIQVASSLGAGRIMLVERLDGGAPYQLVDLTNRRGRGVLVALDARSGELRWARLNPPHIQRLFDAPSPMHTRFVWQPSESSFFSPFFPFSEQRVAGRTSYVRLLDGRRFTSLTNNSRRRRHPR